MKRKPFKTDLYAIVSKCTRGDGMERVATNSDGYMVFPHREIAVGYLTELRENEKGERQPDRRTFRLVKLAASEVAD